MKLINQSHEILTDPDKLKLIELAGRTCYKSEAKITPDSASKFVSSIVKSGHWSVLEHSNIAFEIDEGTFWWIRKVMSRVDLKDNYVNDDSYLTLSNLDRFVVSGNFRAWKEYLSIPNVLMSDDLRGINYYLALKWPEIFSNIVATNVMVEPLNESEMSLNERILHKRISVRFATNRGVSHELVRHRSASFSQESTRFVNYKNSNMEFIKPVWASEKAPNDLWLDCMEGAEYDYNKLIKMGWRTEQAREVLPNALKTELIMTDSIRGWYKVMRLRLSKRAHPQIRELMKNLLVDLIEVEPDVFGGLR